MRWVGVIYVLFICAVAAEVQDVGTILNGYSKASSDWESAAYPEKGAPDGKEVHARFLAMKGERDALPAGYDEETAYEFGLASIGTARALVDIGKSKEAYEVLVEAGKIDTKYRVDLSKGKSRERFVEMASVQAAVISRVGKDPFAGAKVSYELHREGGLFIAVRPPEEVDESLAIGFERPDGAREGEKESEAVVMDSSGKVLQRCPVMMGAAGEGGHSLFERITAFYAVKPREKGDEGGPPRFKRTAVAEFLAAMKTASKK
jgi:hypothetical protein